MNTLNLHHRLAAASILICAGFVAAPVRASDAPTDQKFPGITNPSEQRGLNFNTPGVVFKVLVKEGDQIKKGDLLAQEDDTLDQAELLVKNADAVSSKLQIDAAVTDLAQKKVEAARSQEMFDKKVLGKSELEKAILDVQIGDIRVKLAQAETHEKELEAKAVSAKIEQKKLYSTIDGIVQKINVHEGELATNDPKTPCLTVVSNEPLYVEVDLPVKAANHLMLAGKDGAGKDSTLWVRYADQPEAQAAPIIYFNPVANAAAGTQRVRAELPNPGHVRSGIQIEVTLDKPESKGVAVTR